MLPVTEMKPSSDAKVFEWIEKNRDPALPADDRGRRHCYVSHCLPKTFDACIKIFHPIYEDVMTEDRTLTWEEAKRRRELSGELLPAIIDAILKEKGIDKSILVRGDSHDAVKGDRLLWKELARKYGVVFHAELNPDSFETVFPHGSWPRYLLGPRKTENGAKKREILTASKQHLLDDHDPNVLLSTNELELIS